jgi:tRNA threonylcarbamoyladenosine modification (KEOPS) complex  Pcc1 subunit
MKCQRKVLTQFSEDSMKAKATVRLNFPTEKEAEITFKALTPETKKPTTTRSKARLEKEGKFLVLKVEAKDTVALRAALNAYLRWIGSMLTVFETLRTQ